MSLFAGSKPGEFDGDVATRSTDHVLRKIKNVDGWSHVKYEGFAMRTNYGSLKNEVNCLADCHEESSNSFVRDSYRSTFFNLKSECFYDGSS